MVNSKIQAGEENLLHVYNRFPIALDHGEGMYVYDTEGRKFLDFAAGFAVTGLGYSHKKLNEALKTQIDKIYHISNLYYHENCGEAARELNRISGMDRVFFTNSGSEANEGALKAARRYAYTKKTGRYEFIAMENSFHGRSFGAVSVTGHDSYREPFEPVVPGVRFAKFNDLNSVEALVNEKTCAIILEPLQGEGGINLATQDFMEGIRRICDENGILMICDEVRYGPYGYYVYLAGIWGKTGYSYHGKSNWQRNTGRCVCDDPGGCGLLPEAGRPRGYLWRKPAGMYRGEDGHRDL